MAGTAVRIEGSIRIPAPRAEVWRHIVDPRAMASCVPGCSSIETLSPTRYAAKVTVGIGPIKANFNLIVDIVAEEAPARVESITRGEEGSRASIVSAENVVTLAEIDPTTTELAYVSEVSVLGRLGRFGLGVVRKKAAALGEEFAAALRARMADATIGASP